MRTPLLTQACPVRAEGYHRPMHVMEKTSSTLLEDGLSRG